jgi:hypothetical protein
MKTMTALTLSKKSNTHDQAECGRDQAEPHIGQVTQYLNSLDRALERNSTLLNDVSNQLAPILCNCEELAQDKTCESALIEKSVCEIADILRSYVERIECNNRVVSDLIRNIQV